jgi:hypothetical protein
MLSCSVHQNSSSELRFSVDVCSCGNTILFPSSLNSSVTDFGFSFLLFSYNISTIIALCPRTVCIHYQKTLSSICSPSPHPHSAVDTMFNPLKETSELQWRTLTLLVNTQTRRFIFISRNHGHEPLLTPFKVNSSSCSYWCFYRIFKAPLCFILSVNGNSICLCLPSLIYCFASETAFSLPSNPQRLGSQTFGLISPRFFFSYSCHLLIGIGHQLINNKPISSALTALIQVP